ncbi:MAG: site-specific DNA-methyltransferase [Streptococcus intermedius]|uniref:Site-specific DNA-methyltransferase n=1 Tax=Streptococcus intermedius TaxID=1338 RepID=A0A930WFK0_STRIT|nr:site-specific DNA-methyltransferase [Streptococcus intermedius]
MPATFNERPHQNEKAEALAYVRRLMYQARKESNHEDLPKLEKLLELIDSKRYGLVWEEHAELVEEEMKTKIPVFVEDETRKIQGNPESEDYNFLLEGDNLHSLYLLQKTHVGKIDVIYIDPPYNTGNKDFIYNDKIVDKTDGYSHSKWLSFMSKRLELAKELLSETGVIFISIDDNEQAQLKLLCDEVFGEDNFVTSIHWKRSESQNNNAKQLSIVGESVLCYALNKFRNYFNKIELQESAIKEYRYEDDLTGRRFRRGTIVDNTRGKNLLNIKSPTGIKKVIKSIRTEEFFKEKDRNGEIYWTKTGTPYLKIFLDKSEGQISNNWFDKDGVNEDAAEELSDLNINFNFSKPKKLIMKLISLKSDNNSVILDFFAGSGTTGHAVAQLNKEDGGKRKYILCTNNENKICEEVTYKRLSNIQEELPHNLKYFKTRFIEKEDEELEYSLLNNVKTLIELEHAIDLSESDKAVAFSLSAIRELDLTGIKTVYVRQHSHALMDKEDLVRYEGIELIDVPEYYFAKEMREAGL